MSWLYLVSAIALEVVGTLSLRAAATGRRRWYAVVLVGYLGSFVLLALALGEGLGIGVAYGIWTAVGVYVAENMRMARADVRRAAAAAEA